MPVRNEQIIDFGPDSMGLEGTQWWRPDGGDHFKVRDVLMGPEGMSVRTADGRTLDGKVFETYVQSDVPIKIPKQAPVEKINVAELDPDTPIERENSFGSLKHSHPGTVFKEDTRHYGIPKDPINEPLAQKPQVNDIDPIELGMIERVLGAAKFDGIKIEIEDDGAIATGISTLKNILNVKSENIEKFLVNKISQNLTNIAKTTAEKLMSNI